MPSYTNLQPGWPLWFFHGFNCILVATGRPSTWDKRGSLKRKDVQRGVGPNKPLLGSLIAWFTRRIRSFTCESGAQKKRRNTNYFDILWMVFDVSIFFRFSDSGRSLSVSFFGVGGWPNKNALMARRCSTIDGVQNLKHKGISLIVLPSTKDGNNFLTHKSYYNPTYMFLYRYFLPNIY